jgi:hypothetical protein
VILRGRVEPIGESRRRSVVPCSLYDLRNSLVLQSGCRRCWLLLMLLLLRLSLTPVSGGLLCRAVRLLMTLRRSIEQDKVLLRRQTQILTVGELLRGWSRQAGFVGKPCLLILIRGEGWRARNGGGVG